MPALDIHGVQATIPHRPPMLLVDEVVDWTSGQTLHARRTFAVEDPIFAGHFPGFPVLPGVLGIEALAQSAALLTNLSLGRTAAETLFFFMGIKEARFHKPVSPGQTVDLHVTLDRTKRDIYWYQGVAKVDGTLCTEASFIAKFMLKEKGN